METQLVLSDGKHGNSYCKNYTTTKLYPSHHINVTAWRLCSLNETATVCHKTECNIKITQFFY